MKSAPIRRRSHGFTLIEMLTVITIIVILAGVTMLGYKHAKIARDRNKATVQVKLLANACEEFKADNGYYPGINDNTVGDGKNMSKELYSDLYWDSDRDGSGPKSDPDQKIYISELDPDNNRQGWTDGKGQSVRILDPWGNEYRYRKGSGANNPDFDLWSAGPDGKTNPDNPKDRDNNDDIKL